MDDLIKLVVLAGLGEAIWETLKFSWQKGKLSVDRIGALAVGISVALISNMNIFEILQLETSANILGVIFTGVLISRGANFMHDLLVKVEKPN